MNRISDAIFFGTIFFIMIIVMIIVFCDLTFPWWLQFWWIILLPMAMSKVLFPKSKFTNWLNKDITKQQ